MKCINIFICIYLLFMVWGNPVLAQKLIKKAGVYQLVENSQTKKISDKEAKELLLSYPESKELYENSRSLRITSMISLGASLPILGYYGLSTIDLSFGALAGISKPKKVDKTPLYIGGGLIFIGVLTGITNWVIYNKAIDAYNNQSENKKSEDHSLHLSVQPGSVTLKYHF